MRGERSSFRANDLHTGVSTLSASKNRSVDATATSSRPESIDRRGKCQRKISSTDGMFLPDLSDDITYFRNGEMWPFSTMNYRELRAQLW
jgi:hypothetical protein